MKPTEALDGVERKPLKYGASGTQPSFVRGGQVFDTAMTRTGWNRATAAGHYGTSESLLSRQVSNQDNQHLSFQRICEMPAAFLVELVFALIEARVLMRIRRRAILDHQVGA